MNTFDVGRKQLTDKPIIPVVDTRYLNLNLILVLVHLLIIVLVLVLNLVISNLLYLILTFIIPVVDIRYLKHTHVLILFLLHIFYPDVQNSFCGHQVHVLILIIVVVLIFMDPCPRCPILNI